MAFVFGYGSLLFRPDFPHLGSRVATVRGWMRRFDQGSPDHRGTPERLGRVVTLVPFAGAECVGAVFEIAPDHESAVLAALDHRERGGYVREELDAVGRDDGQSIRVITWVAKTDNPFYLGPGPIDEVIEQIANAHGPSGSNVEYVLRLAETLRAWSIEDPHVTEIADRLRERLRTTGAEGSNRPMHVPVPSPPRS